MRCGGRNVAGAVLYQSNSISALRDVLPELPTCLSFADFIRRETDEHWEPSNKLIYFWNSGKLKKMKVFLLVFQRLCKRNSYMWERKQRLMNAYYDVIRNWTNKVSENKTKKIIFRRKRERRNKGAVLEAVSIS